MTARIGDIRRFNAVAQGPGETSGPAERVTFVVLATARSPLSNVSLSDR